ncbi:MAG: type 4a pilus biogenesis protein PilO [Thermoleophilaceae bacterium]
MSATSRDKKLLLLLIPVIAIVGFWFLLLGPKRQDASKLGEEQTKQEKKADEATANADRLKGAAKNFRGEYTTLVRLGKAVPSSVDMPSLLVQLNRAAAGTGIRFGSITAGERASAAAASSGGSAPPPSGGGSGGGQAPPVAAGGQQAQSSPGQAAEKGNNAAASANQSNEARSQDPTDTQTSTSAKQGAVPVGGGAPSQTAQPGAAAGAGGAATSRVPGLDSVPLDMSFRGNYFDLARFFHRLKRFVRVANEKIKVQGRLLTIDGLSFTGGARLVAVVKATVYLVPKDQGVTAGATPSGPQPTPTSTGGSPPAPTSSTAAPTATVSPR